eukprot:936305-Pelagomonas_calceolata.AAC.4
MVMLHLLPATSKWFPLCTVECCAFCLLQAKDDGDDDTQLSELYAIIPLGPDLACALALLGDHQSLKPGTQWHFAVLHRLFCQVLDPVPSTLPSSLPRQPVPCVASPYILVLEGHVFTPASVLLSLLRESGRAPGLQQPRLKMHPLLAPLERPRVSRAQPCLQRHHLNRNERTRSSPGKQCTGEGQRSKRSWLGGPEDSQPEQMLGTESCTKLWSRAQASGAQPCLQRHYLNRNKRTRSSPDKQFCEVMSSTSSKNSLAVSGLDWRLIASVTCFCKQFGAVFWPTDT